MNIRSAGKAAPPFLLSFAALAAAATVALAQITGPPPIKMGLWQSKTSSKLTGVENTPMARMATSQQHINQGCMTPETWKKDFADMQNKSRQDCTPANVHRDGNKFSVDEVCADQKMKSSVHIEILVDDDEHTHGSGVVKASGAGLPQEMTANLTFSSHFLSSSCGEVKPGRGKVIK
jgi:hypothetical protein